MSLTYAKTCQKPGHGHMPKAHNRATGECDCPCHLGQHRNPWWSEVKDTEEEAAAPQPETTLPRMTLNADTEKALKTAGRKVTEWTTERDRIIKQAVAEGGSLREIGAAVGISHTAVKFIAHGRGGPRETT